MNDLNQARESVIRHDFVPRVDPPPHPTHSPPHPTQIIL